MTDITTQRKIVLKAGAPPTSELHIELRCRVAFGAKLDASLYDASPLIGKPIASNLDAVNEERLLFITGDSDYADTIGIYERHFFEEGVEADIRECDLLRWEFFLVDEAGTVWSELVNVEG
jgi:hypothetical protein